MPAVGLLWLGTVIDASLALAPATVLVWRSRSTPAGCERLQAVDLAAMAFSAFVFVLHVHTRSMRAVLPLSTLDEIGPLLPVFALGLLAVRRPWWPWAVPLLAVITQSEDIVPMMRSGRLPDSSEFQLLWPPAIAAVIASAWPVTLLASAVDH